MIDKCAELRYNITEKTFFRVCYALNGDPKGCGGDRKAPGIFHNGGVKVSTGVMKFVKHAEFS